MNLGEQKEKSLQDLTTIFTTSIRRYWRIAFAPAAVVLALVLFTAFRMPDYYSSDFLIYIQPQRISSKLIETPDNDEMKERLEALLQEILSRPRLRAIIEQYNLYPHLEGPIGKAQAIEAFRNAILIGPAKSATGAKLQQTFRIGYTHSDPKTAYEVTDAVSSLFIEESVVTRRSETQGTEEFLDAELSVAKRKLEATEKSVREFVTKNFEQLPENLKAGIARLENSQSQMATNSQLITTNLARKENLQREYSSLKAAGGTVSPSQLAGSGSPQEQLSQLESALLVLTSRYSSKHPDVINTRKRIQSLRSQVSNPGAAKATGGFVVGESVAARSVRRELEETGLKILSLEKENSRLRVEIEKLEQNIKVMPIREQELLKIKRDYENIQSNYSKLLSAKEDASLQSNLVKSQKATQFRIVEPAETPVEPAGPNRILIIAAGILAALAIFSLVPMVMYILNGSFKFRSDIEEELGLEVIGVIPPMITPRQVIENRKVVAFCSLVSLVVLAGGGAFIFVAIN